jgi:hypothetical protein
VRTGTSSWSCFTIEVASEDNGPRVTALTGKIDQAALYGLLRRLYSLGRWLVVPT